MNAYNKDGTSNTGTNTERNCTENVTNISLYTRTMPGGETTHENVKIKHITQILTDESLEST
jgi:hypothetical protein